MNRRIAKKINTKFTNTPAKIGDYPIKGSHTIIES